MNTITLQEFHTALAEAYAVCVNDTLYFVGYDNEDLPYVADNDNEDRIELNEVDGDIEAIENGYFFYVGGEAIELKPLYLGEAQPQK